MHECQLYAQLKQFLAQELLEGTNAEATLAKTQTAS